MQVDFEHGTRTNEFLAMLGAFMDAHVYPAEREEHAWNAEPANLWQPWPGLERLKALAKEAGLWNLFLPRDYEGFSPGLSNIEYAPLAEVMGRVPWSAEVFNCAAPDTGNMEVLARYGSPQQQATWLHPLLNGEIRSAFAMTEPEVASSDATNIATTIVPDGDDYVVTGRKWWISGALDPRCKVLIVLGSTLPNNPRHQQHSMILVPRDAPGLRVIRSIRALGRSHSPGGEAELVFDAVRVPKANLILGEGRGFEVAQGRLGPGRIHHCMRSIGQAQRALEMMVQRVEGRTAFGKKLSELGSIRQDIALSWCEIEQARLLTLKAADTIDKEGVKGARSLIAAIKVVAPRMATRVIDRAMQVHGAAGFSDDVPLGEMFATNRFLRMADGPDEVHLSQLGKIKIAEYGA
jgi:acyl-CoA dehydrogenase